MLDWRGAAPISITSSWCVCGGGGVSGQAAGAHHQVREAEALYGFRLQLPHDPLFAGLWRGPGGDFSGGSQYGITTSRNIKRSRWSSSGTHEADRRRAEASGS